MPHGHHGHGGHARFRGGRGGARTVFVDVVPDAVFCDGDVVNGVCVPYRDQAGDILPTFVTPDDARRYIDEIDVAYARLDGSIQPSSVPADFKSAWTVQFSAWRAFAVGAKATVGWLNTTAVMQQADRFLEQLKGWQTSFVQAGGSSPGPMPVPPGQGVPGASPVTPGSLTALVVAVGGLAALMMFGPTIARAFK